jgi:hypothetical protein
MTIQNGPELCIAGPVVDASNGEELDVISQIVLHNGYELPGSVIHVANPAERKVAHILDVVLHVLYHTIVSSQESQPGICCPAQRQSGQIPDRAWEIIGIRGTFSQHVKNIRLIIAIPRAVIKVFRSNGGPCFKGLGSSHQYALI